MKDKILPIGLELGMYSNKASLKKALLSLPINSLAVIAAELLHNMGGVEVRPDMPEAAESALDSLYIDVLNAACGRLRDDKDFLWAVNSWYNRPEADSRKWYQIMLRGNTNGQA